MKRKTLSRSLSTTPRAKVVYAVVPVGGELTRATFTSNQELAQDMVRNAPPGRPLEIWEVRHLKDSDPG